MKKAVFIALACASVAAAVALTVRKEELRNVG